MDFEVEIYDFKPDGFNPEVEVSACYLEWEGKLLMLQRPKGKLEPERWGVPGGKLEKGESPKAGALRELFEETGISAEDLSQITYVSVLYFRKGKIDYVYYLFKVDLCRDPEIRLSAEHQSYRWLTAEELQEIPLMSGGQKVLKHYRTVLASAKQDGNG